VGPPGSCPGPLVRTGVISPGLTGTHGRPPESNGDGTFLLPGPDGPLATIRLVNLRDGIENLELFVLARNRCGDGPVCAALSRLVVNATAHVENATLLEDVRRRLGHAATGTGPCPSVSNLVLPHASKNDDDDAAVAAAPAAKELGKYWHLSPETELTVRSGGTFGHASRQPGRHPRLLGPKAPTYARSLASPSREARERQNPYTAHNL
jgi:hypothetical protein